MKKVLGIAIAAVFVMAFAISAYAQDLPNVHMNIRFWHTDNCASVAGGTDCSTSRWSLHAVEISADQEVDNIGGSLIYRIDDEGGSGNPAFDNADAISYPVEMKVYIKGGPHKLALGLQGVPFGIYKWNNLYHPLLDVPGQMGQLWDRDWGLLYTYNEKPVLLDIGYFDNAGETTGNEGGEKNTFTIRLGYDILPNWNLGVSYLDGDSTATVDGDTKKWAVDTTWGIVPNLALNAQYVDYDDTMSYASGAADDGDYGAVQLKYDIVKVPAPLNKISLVGQYSWDDPKNGEKDKQYQEEIVLQAGKNLSIFWQNVQDKQAGRNAIKYHYLAVKYNLF